MKRFRFVLVVFTALFACMAVPAVGLTTTFTGLEDDDWNEVLNWDRRIPTASDHAVIPADQTPFIGRNDSGVCQTIALSGTLELRKDSVLTIGGESDENTSTISGTMTVGKLDTPQQGPATLKISGDHTITGDDGTIMLVWDSVIDDNGDEGDKLTIEDSCPPEVTCKIQHKPTADCSLTVTGQGSIKVALYNDAFVVADDGACLTLADHDKDSGCCGFWIAGPQATLKVLCNVTGAGTWKAVDLDYAGKFLIGDDDPGCVLATGDVILTGGYGTVLEVSSNGHFCTSGRLEYKSVANPGMNPTTPHILVATDMAAMFGVECSSVNCPE